MASKFAELADEIKIRFNVMTIPGLKICINKYLEWYLDCPYVYDLYLGYILYVLVVKKIGFDIFSEGDIILKVVSNLPIDMIKYIFSNFIIKEHPIILEHLIKNNDVNVIEYVINDGRCINFLKVSNEVFSNVLQIIANSNNIDLFKFIFVTKLLKNNINIKINDATSSVTNFLNEMHCYLDNDNVLRLIQIEGIIIEEGISRKEIINTFDMLYGRKMVNSIREIELSEEDNGEFIIKKGNYKYTIYKKEILVVNGYYIPFYGGNTISINKIRTIIY